MSVKFANNAFGTLNAGINNSATSITLSSGQGARFPTLASGEYFYATLIDTSNNLEVVKCTARSTDVLTITRAQESTTAQAFAIGDRIELRVTAAGLTDAANPYDKDTSSTGSFALPSGTTAQQPTAADSEGHIRYDTDDSVVYYSNGTDWLKVSSAIPVLSSISGVIKVGSSTSLTLTGTGFLASNLVVNFTQSADSIDADVTVTPTSDTAATVTVSAAVYNNVTGGNLVSINVTNSDNVTSGAITTTAVGLPTGGTTSTSGGYRYHKFTSSGNFVVPTGWVDTFDIMVVAGGGGGGRNRAGGGGAGGMLTSTGLTKSSGTYSIVVGGGGNGMTSSSNSTGGSNSSGLSVTAIGGGRGGGNGVSGASSNGGNGGSGGGAGSSTGSGGNGTSGQGNSGGSTSGNSNGSGGGGKGGSGSNSVSGSAPGAFVNGGAGATGYLGSYAQGGGGASSPDGSGANTSTPSTANSGNGGGGGSGNVNGIAGSSGIVVIRYAE